MMMRPALRPGLVALAVAALLAVAADAALAAAPGSRNTRTLPRHAGVKAATAPAAGVARAPEPAAEQAAKSGMMAFLDPETGLVTGPIGQLVPPADQRAAAANVVLRSVPLPRGGWIIDLQGTGQEFYVLQIDPLGTRRVVCVQDPRAVSLPLPLPTVTHGEER